MACPGGFTGETDGGGFTGETDGGGFTGEIDRGTSLWPAGEMACPGGFTGETDGGTSLCAGEPSSMTNLSVG